MMKIAVTPVRFTVTVTHARGAFDLRVGNYPISVEAPTLPAGAAPTVYLDLTVGGTFTRSSEGSYLTGAPTDGSTAFLAWAAVNERRIENRGDGLGDMLLMEGSRTNLLLWSRDMTNAAWSIVLGTTRTAGQNGCDGAASATRVEAASGAYLAQQVTAVSGSLYTMSAWGRGISSGNIVHRINSTGGDAVAVGDVPASATFARRSVPLTLGAALSHNYAQEGRAVGAFSAGARDGVIDLFQNELGAFPSSPIRTTTAAVTRGADVLSYAVGEYPASFLTAGFRIRCAPDFSSAENTGLTEDLIGMTTITNGAVAFDSATLGVYRPGVGWLFTACTWSRGQLLTITVRPGVSVTLSGFTTGDGTYALSGPTWVADALSVGQRAAGGTISFFGRIATTIEAL